MTISQQDFHVEGLSLRQFREFQTPPRLWARSTRIAPWICNCQVKSMVLSIIEFCDLERHSDSKCETAGLRMISPNWPYFVNSGMHPDESHMQYSNKKTLAHEWNYQMQFSALHVFPFHLLFIGMNCIHWIYRSTTSPNFTPNRCWLRLSGMYRTQFPKTY